MQAGKLIKSFGQSLSQKLLVQSFWIFILVSSLILHEVSSHSEKASDNEFAEFEEFNDEMSSQTFESIQDVESVKEEFTAEFDKQTADPKQEDEDDAIVEEEFDGDVFDVIDDDSSDTKTIKDSLKQGVKPLQFADVPAHLRNNWSNYQVELVLIIGLVVYLVNYVIGKQTNNAISMRWYEQHADLLNEQFSLVGDDGSDAALQGRAQLIRETDSTIKLHCSGRAGVLNLLVQLKLVKRQDLISVIMQLIRPKQDHVAVRVEFEAGEMDSYVFVVGQRKSVHKLARELTDLAQYTTEKKNGTQLGLPACFSVYSEISEAMQAILDPRVVNTLTKYEKSVEYLHVSDQYSGLKPQEGEQPAKLPEYFQVVVLGYNLPAKFSNNDSEAETALMALLFYCVEKVRRFRLSREGKAKAEKNRKDAQESFLKVTHAQRAEAAAARREEKIRERKQRVMEEEDPEKQRRLEKIEQKREAKKKQPRMKQLKVKSG